MRVFRPALLSGLCIILLFSCREKPLYNIQKTDKSDQGMVVSSHPLATEAGAEILRLGGSAMDAAIATQLTLAVVHPRAGNIGGGGFILHRSSLGSIVSLDFREVAPMAAYREMFLDSTGEVVPNLSTYGGLAVGVPGTIRGIEEAYRRYGKLDWYKLFDKPIQYARDGFRVTAREAGRLNKYRDDFLAWNSPDIPFIKAEPWQEGDILVQKALARTLERISRGNPDDFYTGETAEMLIQKVKERGGIITREDLSAYKAKWREPLKTDYKQFSIYTMGPPSSGGIVIEQVLEMLEGYQIAGMGANSASFIHHFVEAERRAFADRALYLGDMDFIDIPLGTMLDSAYLSGKMADFDPITASKSDASRIDSFPFLESYETTHISVIDKQGNAVALTTTLNGNYGSKVYVEEGGFFLNNQMDDFVAKPGFPNMYAIVGNEKNAIAPGKRMLSSMSPTIVVRAEKPYLILGSPGGPAIISSVLRVILNVTEHGMPVDQAVAAGRVHHQWLPDVIKYEGGYFRESMLDSLRSMGHQLEEVEEIGAVEAIQIDERGVATGAADTRRDDHARGLGIKAAAKKSQ